jgi:hypothetical protein
LTLILGGFLIFMNNLWLVEGRAQQLVKSVVLGGGVFFVFLALQKMWGIQAILPFYQSLANKFSKISHKIGLKAFTKS